MILDVIAKPEEPLTYVGREAGAKEYVSESGKVYWTKTDELGNEIWFTERAKEPR